MTIVCKNISLELDLNSHRIKSKSEYHSGIFQGVIMSM